jgi:MoxR-like ATPase
MSSRTRFLRQIGVYGYDQVEPIILAALLSEDPLLLIGRHGTGKTYLLNSLSEALALEHRHYNASLVSFDDLVGFPYPDKDGLSIRFIETPATVWGAESVLVDELNRCKPEHQNRFFSLVYERRVQGMPLTKLRYRWAAMNPAGEDNGYLGAEPLDPALADRFSFIVTVADWSDLSAEEKAAVTDPRGDGAISRDGGELRQFLSERLTRFKNSLQSPPSHLLGYASTVSTTLGQAGLRLSPRRTRQLARNLLAACCVSDLPQERLFRLVLRASVPQIATGEAAPRETIDGAHRVAWEAVALTGREKWLHDFAIEADLAKKAGLLLTRCPDPDTGSVAVSQLIAGESLERVAAFALAVQPHLLESEAPPVGPDGLSDLGRIFAEASEVNVEVEWRDAHRNPLNPPAGGKWDAAVPGHEAAIKCMAAWPKKRRLRATHYLNHLVGKTRKVPENWADLLRDFERCVTTAGKLGKNEDIKSHGTTTE